MAITAEKLRVEVEGDTSGATEALDTLEKKGKGVPKWVGGAKTALLGLFGLGAGAGAALTAGLMGNIELSEVGNKVSAALALTGPQSKAAGEASGSLWAGAYGESMADVGGAVESVMSSIDGMKNANAATLKGATADVMNFAKAYEVDVDRAAQVAGQAVRQGLAPDFATAMDLMVASSSRVPKAVRGDLMDAVDEYGGFFSQVGIGGDQAFSMLAAGAQKGMYGIDKTGDAVKEFSVRMLKSDKTASKALSGIGLNMNTLASDMAEGGEKGGQAMQKVVAGLLKIKDPGDRAAAAIDLFGAPLEDLGTNNIPKFLKSLQGIPGGLGDVSQATEDMGAKLNSGPGTAIKTLGRTISTEFMKFASSATPALTGFATAATAQVVPAADAIRGAISGTIGFFQNMFAVIQQNSTLFSIIAGIIAAIFVPGLVAMGVAATVAKVKVVGAWIAARAAAVGSVAAQSLAMARTVIGWVAMAAAAVVSGAQTVIIWGMYQAAAIRGAAASVAAHARIVVGWALAAAGAVANGAIMVATMVATAARVAAGWVLMGLQATLNGAKIALGWVLAAAATVANGAVMAASMAATAARVVAGWVLMATQSMLQAARMAAAWFIALGPIGWVIAAVVALVVLIIANWDKVKAATIRIFSAVASFAKSVWSSIKAAVSNAVTALKAAVVRAVTALASSWRSTMNAIKSVATAIWNAIKAAVTNAVNGVKAAVTSAVNRVKSVWSSAMNAVRAVATAIWGAIKNYISNVIGNVLNIVGRVRQVVGVVRSAFNSAKSAAQSALNGLVSFVRGIPGKLVSILMGAAGRFRSAGANIINGLKNGIMGAFGNVKAAVSNGLAAVRNLLPFSPAKEGPFSGKGWTLYSGRSIPEAMADGIRDTTGKAKAAALAMAKRVSGAMALPDVTGGAITGVANRARGTVTPGATQHGTGTGGRGGNTFIFNTHNPIAEKESVTVNKTLQRAAGLGW